MAGVPAAIRVPRGSSNGILLANGQTASVLTSHDTYLSTGLGFERNLTGLYVPPQETVGEVGLFIQGRQFLSSTQSVLKRAPVSIAAVLRTD